MTKPKQPRPLCIDGTLAHHWLVTDPRYRYVGTMETGKLIETTHQACKKCGLERENECEVILDEND